MTAWITNSDFASLPLIDVFDKEHGKKEIPDSEYFNKHILFRKKFNLPKAEKATVKISADDYYKLYINGKFVCMGPSPAYPHKYYYNEIDVTDFLCDGENTIAVHTYYMGMRNRVYVSGDNMHGLFFEMYVGGKKCVCSDESWKTAYHTGYTGLGTYGYQTSYLECYNSAAPEVGFEKPLFDDSLWQNAVINHTIAEYNVLSSRVRLLDVYDVKPAKIETVGNTVRIDIGTGICGYLEYKAKGVRGSEITILSGEELNADGSVRFEARCNCRFEEKHVLSGGTDTLSQFDYKGIRYINLVLPEGCELDYDSVKIIARHYPFELKADISSDNKRLERIFKLCADTVKYGVQEVCVDCPTREKGQYLGDAGIIAMVHAYVTDSTEVLEKVLSEFAASAAVCPGIMAISTSSYNQEIADYSLMYPLFALWCYRKNRNTEFLSEIYPAIKGLIKYFGERMRDGVVCDIVEKWNLVDWPWNLRDNYDFKLENPTLPGKHNVIAAYYIGACMCFEEIRKILGKPAMCDIEKMKSDFVAHYYDEKAGLFRDTPDSEHHALHSNVLPLLFDIGMNDALKERIIDMIREKRFKNCNYFAFFVLLALEKEGKIDLMRELICDDGAWTRMIENGATVCFETWHPDLKTNASLFHPWMSYPVLFADKIK